MIQAMIWLKKHKVYIHIQVYNFSDDFFCEYVKSQ